MKRSKFSKEQIAYALRQARGARGPNACPRFLLILLASDGTHQYCAVTLRVASAARRPLWDHRVLVTLGLLSYGLLTDPDTGAGGLPCLWRTLFGIECPGCGLSRAGALLLRGRVHDAAMMNWCIFPVVAVLAFHLFQKRPSRY
jgi:hypothetical protein